MPLDILFRNRSKPFFDHPFGLSDSQKTGKEGFATAAQPTQQQPAQKRLKVSTYAVENTLVNVLQLQWNRSLDRHLKQEYCEVQYNHHGLHRPF
ncbi:MAG: hypothetical protein AAB197_04850 [Deltaproteobacteria bacterium]